MSDFSRISDFPHLCQGAGCAICALVQRRKAKAEAKVDGAKKPDFTGEKC